MRLQDNEKACRVKKNNSLILYQRIAGDFYTINSEGKFTLSNRGTQMCEGWSCAILFIDRTRPFPTTGKCEYYRSNSSVYAIRKIALHTNDG